MKSMLNVPYNHCAIKSTFDFIIFEMKMELGEAYVCGVCVCTYRYVCRWPNTHTHTYIEAETLTDKVVVIGPALK